MACSCIRVAASTAPSSPNKAPRPTTPPGKKWENRLKGVALGGMLIGTLWVTPVVEAAPRFPPIDTTNPGRCDRGFVGNTIGQANAVTDTLLDLRKCVYKGQNLQSVVLSGALLQETDFSGATLLEAVFSKSFAMGANFEGANLANAILDRANFSGSTLKNADMTNTIITGTQFAGANLENVNLEDALIGKEDVKRICQNPTLVGKSRAQVGCRD